MRNNATYIKREANMLEESKVNEWIKEKKITYKFVRNKTKDETRSNRKQDGTFTKCDQETAEVFRIPKSIIITSSCN